MGPTSVPACFAVQVLRAPDAVAVSQSEDRLTYRELDERSDHLARWLLDRGTAPEEPVAVDMSHSPALVVALLAVLKAGAAYLPVHSAFPPERAQLIVERAGCRVLLADPATRRRGLPVGCEVLVADGGTGAGTGAGTDSGRAVAAAPSTPDHLAYVMHTSGSSGEPKAVEVTHRGVVGLALDRIWDGGRHQRVLMLAPFAFGVSTYEIWVPLLRGGTIVIPPPGPLDVRTLRSTIARERISALHLTAGLFRVVAEEAPDCLAGVREVLTGGDVIAPKAVAAVLDACPGLVVRAMYGGTEVSSFATSSPMAAPFTPGRTVPVGRAMDGVVLHVLDEQLRPVPPGEVGELHIGGDRLARGYRGRPDLTDERFVPDPFAGGRMYRTGDLVRLTGDGLVDFVGRSNDQVKIRGFRVEPAEVEAVLAGCAGVAHVAVLARAAGDGHRLVAYVVPAAGTEVDVTAVLEHGAGRLPDYMLPADVVVLAELPLTSNGKLDRTALPEPAGTTGANHRAPTTERQAVLCALFGEVLGADDVGLDDSFFDLDGQSLLAMRLLHRIETALGVALSIADLFNAPTVSDLDKVIDDRSAGQGPDPQR